ncbi:MAG: hypothetical protein PHS86_03730 [Syntrophaceae bacterium]|nr:hypothetical protein [Syntrophaceae bacterium]
MCTASVGNLLVYDNDFQELMNNPVMDIIHKQVVMTLYSLDLSKRLHEYQKLLPVYLGMSLEECNKLLETIEQAGIIHKENGVIRLTHPVNVDSAESCGCGH